VTTFLDRIGRRPPVRTIASAALAVLALTPAVAGAAPAGSPDPTFDGDGRLILPFGGSPAAMFVQPDGKIVVPGTSSGQDYAVWRLTSAGGLDTTFGRGGTAIADFGGSEYASGGALAPGGKTVVGGDGKLARFTPAGALDPTFGPGGPDGDGKVTLDTSGNWYPSSGMLVQPDGRLVLAGTQSSGTRDFLIKRLQSNGSDDTMFDPIDFGADDYPSYLAPAPGGKTVAVGTTHKDNEPYVVAVARYTAEGKPDPTFGDKGKATLGAGEPTAVAVRADGSVLVVGRYGQAKRLGVKRLTATGAPDGGYGDAGTALPGFQENLSSPGLVPAAVRPDGRLAVVALDVEYNLAVTRFGATGAFDPIFGAGGTTSIDFGGLAVPAAATVQPDGKLLIAGATLQGLRPRLAFARLLGDATAPRSGGSQGTPPPPVVVRCAGRPATIVGTAGSDRLRGTPGADVIVALDGNDRVIGRGGNDVVCGGAGDDRLSGGAGRDVLRGEQGRDRLLGGPGRDRLVGGPGRDRVRL
jgi:uncharacterized delta-60 repeat protein